jgi:hypothetical protein
LKLETPEFKLENIDLKLETPEFKLGSIDLKLETSVIKLENIDLRLETPEFKLENIDLRLETPEFKLENSDLKLETPEFKLESIDLKLETPEFKLQTADFKLETTSGVSFLSSTASILPKHRHSPGPPRTAFSQQVPRSADATAKYREIPEGTSIPGAGLEPARIAPPAPKAGASAVPPPGCNSPATRAQLTQF